jgi:hypothetical protein
MCLHRENVSKIFFSRTTGPVKLRFTLKTLKLSDIHAVQNQIYQNHGPRGSDGATIGGILHVFVNIWGKYLKIFSGTIFYVYRVHLF